MGAYLGLRDSWFWEDDAILDAIETLQDQADGTFYPAEYGRRATRTSPAPTFGAI